VPNKNGWHFPLIEPVGEREQADHTGYAATDLAQIGGVDRQDCMR
jgi:hypothetical protein